MGAKSYKKEFAPLGANSFLFFSLGAETLLEGFGLPGKQTGSQSQKWILFVKKVKQDLSQGQDSLPDSALPIT